MKKIWVVNANTGVIEASGSVSESTDMTGHIPSGSLLVEVPPSSDTQIWRDGAWADCPTRPSENHLWIDGAWQLNAQVAATTLRRKRDLLLVKSDWTQLPNGPLTSERQAAWGIYRQALRDITSQQGYPLEVVWPTAPE